MPNFVRIALTFLLIINMCPCGSLFDYNNSTITQDASSERLQVNTACHEDQSSKAKTTFDYACKDCCTTNDTIAHQSENEILRDINKAFYAVQPAKVVEERTRFLIYTKQAQQRHFKHLSPIQNRDRLLI